MNKIFFIHLVFIVLSCHREVRPEVNTLYLNKELDLRQEEIQAVVKLYDHYNASNKSSKYYEVITKKMMILNYHPAKQLLTVYGNQDTGWSGQYKDVGVAELDRLGKDKITFEKYDSLLVRNDPMISVKTNGKLF